MSPSSSPSSRYPLQPAKGGGRMIIARVDFDFTPLLQSTPGLLPCLDCIGTVDSKDRPGDDLADGWLMMTQVSSAWCAMCATISLRTLQTPTQPVPPLRGSDWRDTRGPRKPPQTAPRARTWTGTTSSAHFLAKTGPHGSIGSAGLRRRLPCTVAGKAAAANSGG